MGSCQNYAFFLHGREGKGPTASEEDRHLGYPVYSTMLALKSDFFIGTGDIVSYDHPAGDSTTPTYRTHRIHKHLQLWFVEGRDYRSPNAMADGPDKTLWGSEQCDWLQRTLKDGDATWKVIITPTPMVGPDRDSKRDNHTNTRGFRQEADRFFSWLKDNGLGNVMSFCDDRHWQYQSVHPTGFEEFSCGALNDENAIPGEKPGGGATTDPEGLIDQRFVYPEPTGGFLHVHVNAETHDLRIAFIDDEGRVLSKIRRPKP